MAELLQLFRATISPDAATRKHAEDRLQLAERTEGVLSSTLGLVAASDPGEAADPARMSAAIFLKNAVARGWISAVPQPDKEFIRANVLEALAQSQRTLKPILFALLLIIVPADYPHAWPDLVQRSVSLLEHRSVAAVEAGLLALQAVMRKYRWTRTPDRAAVDQAIVASFPALLYVGQRALAGEMSSLLPSPANAAEAEARSGHVLYLVLKVYKMSITTELSQHQQDHIVPWGQLFLQTVQKRMSTVAGVPEDVDDRKRYSWWRAKKWAYHNVRLPSLSAPASRSKVGSSTG